MQKEDQLQIAVSNYLKLQYPNVFWCHPPNGGKRNAMEGAKFKSMGVRAGMPDLLIFEQRHYGGFARALAIELKIKPNKVTPEQTECLAQLKSRSWQTEVCYSFDEAKKIIDEYLK